MITRKIYHINLLQIHQIGIYLIPRILIILIEVIYAEQSENLVKTIVLFRHGARSPLTPYKFHGLSDDDEVFWPEGYGNLLKIGKMQLFELGQQLRQRYENHLLPYNKTIAEDVRIVTTPSDRCYESAAILLAGLYSPSVEQKWSEELLWQPVPILYESADRVYMIGQRDACPSYNDELHATIPDITRPDIHYLVDFMSSQVSAKISTISDLFFIADYFHTKSSLNFSQPRWMSKEVYAKLEDFYVESFDYLTGTFKLRRLLAGPLITDIIDCIREVIYSEPKNSKMFLYSGHDSSLHSLGRTMGFEMKFIPKFAASFFFEIHRFSANDYKIKLLYSEDYSMSKLKIWIIPGCDEICPMGKFVQLMDKFIIRNWDQECNVI